ncbi:MAG: magnesium and cobalt transport protein CorA [Candidatus Dactylopiibacterium carminicum]|uniref:Magnesium transport protein CorA n=1 Tax=Candidatus Dactylopiibacterium carminicum TaxID=857335 RepID=A0A272EYB0_9RHOO|nr:magnesium/cobalt transporter CorA [Candidatus Dactylopiibacterium carminicum]KAF7600658.1 magnesium and cobalt transport protein CorA [Candidatus Dactylopiibacterium carminicum]PAS95107.1 MAG: magnesium and cobalt transport protein CorA [Candidatus Dactylopiibacterium carminicum]PAS97912.1 MAG: magnesium and cobalt transport protein CorA [Candidatus Dactylopiibacterium carminicum]PAT00655.1 MAG: magnesium and cobalt transport protein CorA [Candidatus Dactylopiibacterium carminicum]
MSENEKDDAKRDEILQVHLQEVQALLSRHRVVENLVRRQDMPRHDLVEGLVHKQNLVELQKKLDALPADGIARILEALPHNESLVVWDLVKEDRGAAILDELSETVGDALIAGPAKPTRRPVVVNAFELHNGRLRQTKIDSQAALAAVSPIWVDLIDPSAEELGWIKEVFDLALSDPEDLTDLEESARFYIEDESEQVHLRSDFLLDREGGARNVPVAFVLHQGVLFSVRNEELPVFRLQRLRARIQPGYVSDGKDVLLDLYAADVEYSADTLEDVYAALESVGKQVLATALTDTEAARVLSAIAVEEDLNGRVRRNVLDTRRAVSFLIRGRFLSSTQFEDARQILRDIESLDGHTAFLFDKINFLMDATVGFININQNKIIKIFSVASVALLPPTLIASIYGMNFQFMPEFEWKLGYPFAIGLMILSVAIPIWVFRRKGWLR